MRIAMAVPTLLLVAFSRPQDSGRVYQAPDPEPTPEETLALEHMNAMRANPAPFAERIAAYAKTDSTGQWNLVDWKMFMDEIRALKPAPPLVFNLDLLDAARKHSHYITLNDQLGHDETPSKPGFTGARPADRVAAAGYAGLFSAENAGTGHRNGWDSHCRFIIDAGPGGTGGMQPERGHRRNKMSPRHREIGLGMVPDGRGTYTTTHDFGRRDPRMAGGVFFVDWNGNSFYDVGEGVGSVAVTSSDGASTLSWKSGAYALDLKGTGTVTLTALFDGERFARTFPAGTDNIKFDWIIPAEVVQRRADRYLQALEKAGDPASAPYQKALVSLYVHTRTLCLDPERRRRIAELTAPVAADLEARQAAVLKAVRDDAPDAPKILEEQRKPYKGTEADPWFEDAETALRLKRVAQAFLRKPKPAPQERRQLAATLEDSARRMKTETFRSEVEALAAKIRGASDAAR